MTVGFKAAADDPDGTIKSYSWYFGDNLDYVGTKQEEFHRYTKADIYVVELAVRDHDNVLVSIRKQVEVK